MGRNKSNLPTFICATIRPIHVTSLWWFPGKTILKQIKTCLRATISPIRLTVPIVWWSLGKTWWYWRTLKQYLMLIIIIIIIYLSCIHPTPNLRFWKCLRRSSKSSEYSMSANVVSVSKHNSLMWQKIWSSNNVQQLIVWSNWDTGKMQMGPIFSSQIGSESFPYRLAENSSY